MIRPGEFVEEDCGRLGAELVTRLLNDPTDASGAVSGRFAKSDPSAVALSLLYVVGGLLAELAALLDCSVGVAWQRTSLNRAKWAAGVDDEEGSG